MSYHEFKKECQSEIELQSSDQEFKRLTRQWQDRAQMLRYSYHFEWLGRPIIQYPQDIVAMHELIWKIQPDLIIETGIAHGGSLIFYASMLELNAICGGPPDAEVLGIDIDIRAHNRRAIEGHALYKRIAMIEGSSTAAETIEKASAISARKARTLVCLDSNHTHKHVLGELRAYAPLTSVGSYCVVFDTVIDDMPEALFADRSWAPGNNPKSAVKEYLKQHPEFEIDSDINKKLMISVAPDGFLRRVK